MKLIYRPVTEADGCAPEVVAGGAYALFTEEGQMLPQQVTSSMVTKVDDCVRLYVEFIVGKDIIVQGSE